MDREECKSALMRTFKNKVKLFNTALSVPSVNSQGILKTSPASCKGCIGFSRIHLKGGNECGFQKISSLFSISQTRRNQKSAGAIQL